MGQPGQVTTGGEQVDQGGAVARPREHAPQLADEGFGFGKGEGIEGRRFPALDEDQRVPDAGGIVTVARNEIGDLAARAQESRSLVAQKAQWRGLEQQQRRHECAEEFDLPGIGGHGDGFDGGAFSH